MGYLKTPAFTAEQLAADPILQYFQYSHLPEKLQNSSRPFYALAHQMIETLPRNAERSVALRKLLEAKDAAVRANVPGAASTAAFPVDESTIKERFAINFTRGSLNFATNEYNWMTEVQDKETRRGVKLMTEGFPHADITAIVKSLELDPALDERVRGAMLAALRAQPEYEPGEGSTEAISAMVRDGETEGRWGSEEVLAQIPVEMLDKVADGEFVPPELREAYLGERNEEKSALVDGIEGLPETVSFDNPGDTIFPVPSVEEMGRITRDMHEIEEAPPHDDTETKAFGAIGSANGFEPGKSDAGRKSIKKSHRGEGENFVD